MYILCETHIYQKIWKMGGLRSKPPKIYKFVILTNNITPPSVRILHSGRRLAFFILLFPVAFSYLSVNTCAMGESEDTTSVLSPPVRDLRAMSSARMNS